MSRSGLATKPALGSYARKFLTAVTVPPKDTDATYDQPNPPDAQACREEAARCRRLGAAVANPQVRASLDARAADFEARARNPDNFR